LKVVCFSKGRQLNPAILPYSVIPGASQVNMSCTKTVLSLMAMCPVRF
jgi:hypothetical protein